MVRRLTSRSSGLDVSLLGFVVAIISFYATRFSTPAGTSPNLIRFFETAPGRQYPAVLPQDKALLLLLDPTTGTAGATSTGGAATGGIWSLLLLVGLLMVVAGPILAWMRRG